MTSKASEGNTSFSKLLKFSLPVTLIGIFELLLIWIDFVWIYVLNGDANAIAAVRLSGSMVLLVEAVLMAVVSSLLVYISQTIGAKQMDEAKRAVRGVFSFVIYGGIIVTIIGQILLPFIVHLYGVNASTSVYLHDYMVVFLWGYTFMFLNSLLLLLPRYFQKLKVTYQGLTLTVLVNIIVTPLFMLLFEHQGYSFSVKI